MSLSPTTSFVGAFFEQPQSVTAYRKFFPGSHETITISDATSADYTKTVAVVAAGEYRPYNLVKIAVTGGHFTVNAVVTISSANRQVGDVVEFVFTPSDIVSPRTLTIKDDAATPNTLATLSSTTDASRSLSTRKFVLTSAGTWQESDVVTLSTGTLTANTLTLSSGSSVTKFLVGTATWDPASITSPNTTSTTVTVTGAAVGDYVIATLSTLSTAAQLTAYVSATDTVTVVLGAYAGTVNLASGTLNVLVIKAS